uniref:epigen-like n=1 Tax=Myxine glutinosa TaxID=7769 RepID=UPI00358E3BA4
MSRLRCLLTVVVLLTPGLSLLNNTCPSRFESFCINGNCWYSAELNRAYCFCTNGYEGERCTRKSLQITSPPSQEVIVIVLLFGFFALIVIIIALCFIVERSRRSSSFSCCDEYS